MLDERTVPGTLGSNVQVVVGPGLHAGRITDARTKQTALGLNKKEKKIIGRANGFWIELIFKSYGLCYSTSTVGKL